MNHLEARLLVAEATIRQLLQQLGELTWRVAKLEQQPWLAASGSPGGSNSQAFYVVMAPGAGTINGTWSGSAPTAGGSFSGTVYQVSGTGTVTAIGSRTCVNWLPAALANSKACICLPDGAGNFGIVSQSCI